MRPPPTRKHRKTTKSSSKMPRREPFMTEQPTIRSTIPEEQRATIRQYANQNPHVTQEDIGVIFGLSKSTISKIIKRLRAKKTSRQHYDPVVKGTQEVPHTPLVELQPSPSSATAQRQEEKCQQHIDMSWNDLRTRSEGTDHSINEGLRGSAWLAQQTDATWNAHKTELVVSEASHDSSLPIRQIVAGRDTQQEDADRNAKQLTEGGNIQQADAGHDVQQTEHADSGTLHDSGSPQQQTQHAEPETLYAPGLPTQQTKHAVAAALQGPAWSQDYSGNPAECFLFRADNTYSANTGWYQPSGSLHIPNGLTRMPKISQSLGLTNSPGLTFSSNTSSDPSYSPVLNSPSTSLNLPDSPDLLHSPSFDTNETWPWFSPVPDHTLSLHQSQLQDNIQFTPNNASFGPPLSISFSIGLSGRVTHLEECSVFDALQEYLPQAQLLWETICKARSLCL